MTTVPHGLPAREEDEDVGGRVALKQALALTKPGEGRGESELDRPSLERGAKRAVPDDEQVQRA